MGSGIECFIREGEKYKATTFVDLFIPESSQAFLELYQKDMDEYIKEGKKSDQECFAEVEFQKVKLEQLELSLSDEGFHISKSIGYAIWPCPEVMTYTLTMQPNEIKKYMKIE
jgi:hypothetical protein